MVGRVRRDEHEPAATADGECRAGHQRAAGGRRGVADRAAGPGGRRRALAAVAALAFFPLHARHLHYGLKGERPPHALATLAAMAAIHVAALAVIGPAWSFMLATLAVSALIVLPAALGARRGRGRARSARSRPQALHPGEVVRNGDTVQYLVVSVVFRSVLQFALVWLVAATHELMRSRAALAEAATERERARIEGEVRSALERRAERSARRRVRPPAPRSPGPGQAPVLVALDRVLALSREALSDVRRIVAGARLEPAAAAEEARPERARRRRPDPRRRPRRLVARADGPGDGDRLQRRARRGRLDGRPAAVGRARRASPSSGRALRSTPRSPCRWPAVTCRVTASRSRSPWWRSAAWPWRAATISGAACRGWPVAAAALVAGDRWAPRVIVGLGGGAHRVHDGPLLARDRAARLGQHRLVHALLDSRSNGLRRDRDGGLRPLRRRRRGAGAARGTRSRGKRRSTERRRLSSDVHDMLGHSLTAISLKADLARRLLAADRAGAARELDDLLMLADQQSSELASVAGAARAVGFEAEATAAIGLLRSAGITVDGRARAGRRSTPEASTALGWAIREAATNILRHARARHAWITAAADEHGMRAGSRSSTTARRPRPACAGPASPRSPSAPSDRGGAPRRGPLPRRSLPRCGSSSRSRCRHDPRAAGRGPADDPRRAAGADRARGGHGGRRRHRPRRRDRPRRAPHASRRRRARHRAARHRRADRRGPHAGQSCRRRGS